MQTISLEIIFLIVLFGGSNANGQAGEQLQSPSRFI
jgi:hypothetical protein